jgi:hypothetical protein
VARSVEAKAEPKRWSRRRITELMEELADAGVACVVLLTAVAAISGTVGSAAGGMMERWWWLSSACGGGACDLALLPASWRCTDAWWQSRPYLGCSELQPESAVAVWLSMAPALWRWLARLPVAVVGVVPAIDTGSPPW